MECFYCNRRFDADDDFYILVTEYSKNCMLDQLVFCNYSCLMKFIRDTYDEK